MNRVGWVPVLIVTGLIEAILRIYAASFAPVSALITGNPLYFWFSWSLGAYLADQYRLGDQAAFVKISPTVWLVPVFGAWLFKPVSSLTFPFAALLTASAIARLLTQSSAGVPPARMSRFIRRVGICSYSIYLIHEPILGIIPMLIKQVFPAVPYHPVFITVWCWAAFVPIFMIADWMYRHVEKPSITLGNVVARESLSSTTA